MTERTAGKDDLPLASVMGAGSSPVVAESLLETAVANISSCAAPSSAPGSRADVTVNATASGSEVVPRAEDAEPSQEAAQADGSRSDRSYRQLSVSRELFHVNRAQNPDSLQHKGT